METIRYAQMGDRRFWHALDSHLPAAEFANKVRLRQGYVLLEGDQPLGLLRYNLFWDNTPFCTMLLIAPGFRGRGYGRALMNRWEGDMREQGYGMVLTSTRADEAAQHFYRRLGYRDCGGFAVDIPGYEQPLELILIKAL